MCCNLAALLTSYGVYLPLLSQPTHFQSQPGNDDDDDVEDDDDGDHDDDDDDKFL